MQRILKRTLAILGVLAFMFGMPGSASAGKALAELSGYDNGGAAGGTNSFFAYTGKSSGSE